MLLKAMDVTDKFARAHQALGFRVPAQHADLILGYWSL